MDNDNLHEDLAIAPPSQPTAGDVAATQGGAQALQTNAQASFLAKPPQTTPPPTAPPADAGNLNNYRPGGFAWHMANNVSSALTHPATAAALQSPGGLMTAFALGGLQAAGQVAPSPVQPAQQAPPEAVPTSGPGSPGFDSAQQQQAPPPGTPGRHFADGIFKQIGDMGTAGFKGFAQTAAATSARQQQEMKDAQAMATSNAQMLHEQALTHKLGDDAIKESIADGQAQKEAMLTAPPNGGKAGTEDFKDQTSDDLTKLIQTGQFRPSVQTAYPTGRKQIGKDANGAPIFQTTYSVVTPPGQMKLSPETAKYISDNAGVDVSEGQSLPGVQVNALLQRANNAKITQRAFQVKDAQDQKIIDEAQTSDEAKTIFQNSAVTNAVASHNKSTVDPDDPSKTIDDPYATVKAFDYLRTHPDVPKNPLTNSQGVDAWIKASGGPQAWKDLREGYDRQQAKNADTTQALIQNYTENPDKISGHTPAVIAAAQSIIDDPNKSPQEKAQATRLKAQAQATQTLETSLQGARELNKDDIKDAAKRKAADANNPQGLTGKAFLDTLPPARRNALDAFQKGLVAVSPSALERTDKGQAYLQDLYAAFPDLDTSKAPAYMKMRTDFQTGKISNALNSGDTVMKHVGTMLDALDAGATAGLTGRAEAAVNSNTPGRTLSNGAQVLSTELDKFYAGGGVGSVEEKQAWKAKLDPFTVGMTANKLRENLSDFAKYVGGKFEEYQEQWDNGVPSKYIAAPEIIAGPHAVQTYKRATGQNLDVHTYQPGFGPENGGGNSAQDTAANSQTAQKSAPTGPAKKGDVIYQNGHQYVVDSVDASGKVTGAH